MHSTDTTGITDLSAPKTVPKNGLIISADDFGINRTANKNILQLLQQGKLDRIAVIMAGNLSLTETDSLLHGKAALDLHLTIPEFLGCTPSKRGVLRRLLYFSWAFVSGRMKTKTVASLWEKQLLLFSKNFGRLPDGINSHEHLHFFPPYFKIALNLAQKYQVPYLRFANTGIIITKKNTSKIIYLLWKINRRRYLRACSEKPPNHPRSSDFLVSLDWAKKPSGILKKKSKQTIEVVCHPEREEEFEALRIYQA